MKIELSFAELHNPLFLNGTNLQLKLDPFKRQSMHLLYDRTEKELLVYFGGKLAIIPSSNVSSMTPKDPGVAGKIPQVSIATPIETFRDVTPINQDIAVKSTLARIDNTKKIIAQVSSPTSHVFSNEPGKVKD